jgi:hypothetical protein
MLLFGVLYLETGRCDRILFFIPEEKLVNTNLYVVLSYCRWIYPTELKTATEGA